MQNTQKNNQEGWDSPVIFTKNETLPYNKRCKDDAGHGNILPNEKTQQNKFARFYLPSSCVVKGTPQNPLGLNQPVVEFSPLHHSPDPVTRRVPLCNDCPVGFNGKHGATLADLLGFTYYLFRERHAYTSVGNNAPLLGQACSMMEPISHLVPLQPALFDLEHASDNGKTKTPLLNFVKHDVGMTKLYLIMQFGKQPYTGFLYDSLLVFVNMLIHRTRKLMKQSSSDASAQNTEKILSMIENMIDKVLEDLREKQHKILPPLERIDRNKYEGLQQVYPHDALQYLVQKGYLSKTAFKKLGVYKKVLSKEEEKPAWLYAKLGPLPKNPGDSAVVEYYSDVGRTKKVGTTTLRNASFAVAEGEHPIDIGQLSPEERPSKIRISAPFVGDEQRKTITFVATRKGDSSEFLVKGGVVGIPYVLASTSEQISFVVPESYVDGLAWNLASFQVVKMELIIQKDRHTRVIIPGELDKRRSIESKVLGRNLLQVFRYSTTVDGHPIVIFTFKTQHIETSAVSQSEKLRVSQIYVKPKKGKPAGLFELYHHFRSKIEPTGKYEGVPWDQQDTNE